ncbi:MAG: carbohydrate ABC transporter permease [Anaerolineae bacterium]|nr:carbohydrate ABC transporter permease [Anaerolineae bacterium]
MAIRTGRGRMIGPARRPRSRLPGLGVAAAHALLLVASLAAVLPFIWLFLGSFKAYADLAANPWWPRPWVLDNYQQIVTRAGFPQAFLNSLLVVGPCVFQVCFTSAAVGYVFAKYRFPGRDLLFTGLLSTMMVPFAVVMVPLYLTLKDLGLINKLGALIVISVFSTFGTFLLRQTIRDIPNELIEAARIDGAGEVWIFLRVIIPLSGATTAALAVFTFLGTWDDFMFPNIILTTPSVKTLPLVLAALRAIWWDRYELYCAGSMLTVAPVMIVYALMQQQFVRGIAMTGIK